MSQEFFQLLIDGREGLFEFVRMRPCLELSTEPQRGRLSDVANSSGESILQFNTRQNIRSCYSTFSSHKHFAFGLSTAVCIKSTFIYQNLKHLQKPWEKVTSTCP